MLDLILAGPGVTPDLVCDLADEFMAGEVLTRPNAARFCGLSPMTARSIARRLADDESIDVLEVKAGLSVWDFRVICLDMDGTVIQNECIDDMAALHGVGEEVSSVTRAAMEGGTKLTFAESLEKRVAFIRDAPVSVIDEALASVRLQPGAARLIDFCNAHGIRSYVLSGGFTHFTHAIATRLGMTGDFSNMLGIDAERGVLTGTVTGPAGGRILDADGKRRTLEILCHQAGATLGQICTTRSYAYGNMLLSSCLGFSAIPFSVIISFFWFGESVTAATLTGAAVILCSGMMATVATKRTEAAEKAARAAEEAAKAETEKTA